MLDQARRQEEKGWPSISGFWLPVEARAHTESKQCAGKEKRYFTMRKVDFEEGEQYRVDHIHVQRSMLFACD